MQVGNGLIFAFVVALWAAYFVPLAVRRYDEASKAGSIDKFSSLSRVIPHKKHVEEEIEEAPVEIVAPESEMARAVGNPDRPSARRAARRRRRTLLTLLALAAVVTGLAVAAIIPMLSTAAPAALILVWLVACRIQVRGERGLSTRKPRAAASSKDKAVKDSYDAEATIIVSGQFEDIEPDRKHVMQKVELEADALDEQLVIAVPVGATTGETLWHPLPVTLPTYVTKPRAGRTVRTIDFNEPGAWTSGHIEGENTELPTRKDAGEDDQRRAVGH